jgi:hypothetical protein
LHVILTELNIYPGPNPLSYHLFSYFRKDAIRKSTHDLLCEYDSELLAAIADDIIDAQNSHWLVANVEPLQFDIQIRPRVLTWM